MKSILIATAVVVIGASVAVAQQGGQSAAPTIGMGSKTMDSCREDTQKFCATASDYVRKECLVKNWDHISSDCQDALGKGFDGARRGGGE